MQPPAPPAPPVAAPDPLVAWTAACQIGLILTSAGLWFLPWSYPAVPYFSGLCGVEWVWDGAAAGLLLLGWGTAGTAPAGSRRERLGLSAVLAATIGGVSLNQHRLQAWAYQGLLFAVAAIGLKRDERDRALRLLTVSIYAWSAWSKLDASFLHETGPMLAAGLLRSVGASEATAAAWATPTLACLLPLGEGGIAVWLASGRLPRAAPAAAVGMHLALWLTLGPWGLRHSWGVLGWNVFFIGWDLLLFGRRPVAVPAEVPSEERITANAPRRAAWGILLAALLLPVLEPWGGFDLWPSWGLYAPKNQRTELWLSTAAAADLPAFARVELFSSVRRPPGVPADWVRCRLDLASLHVLGVPWVPQHRFQVGAMLAVTRPLTRPAEIAAVVEETAPRFGGARGRHILMGRAALEEFARRYRLNALPREVGP